MKTVTIQIGNSDDKLSQREWSGFIRDMNINLSGVEIHFQGTSYGDKEWQNACWVILIEDFDFDRVKKGVWQTGLFYGQDSVAWTMGDTEFL